MEPDPEARENSIFDAPERGASWVGDFLIEHFRFLVYIGGALFGLVVFGVISIPNVSVPLWLQVVVLFSAVSAGLGMALSSLYFDAPEPDWSRVVEINLDADQLVKITKVSDAVIADMTVLKGRLANPDGTGIYICRWWNHDPQNPVAHCTWKSLPADSELLGAKPTAVEDEVSALRQTYEDTHGKHQWIQDHLYMVVRKLDFLRSQSQNAILEDHLTPSMDDTPIQDVVDDVIPEELQPDQFESPENVDRPDEEVIAEYRDSVDVEEPSDQDANGTETAVADGGTDE